MQVHIINPYPSGEQEAEESVYENSGHRRTALVGWAKRRGLNDVDAEDYADYYQNPRGWFGEPERADITQLKAFANTLGLQATSEEMIEAVENSWFGEKPSHRISAMSGWANRHGLNSTEARRFAEFVENKWYGDPEAHRRDSMRGWTKRRNNNAEENPWTLSGFKARVYDGIISAPYNEYFGVSDLWKDPSWDGGIGITIGVLDSIAYSGIGEMATKSDWAGNFIGLGLGLGTSEGIRRYLPYKGADQIASGQRAATYGVFAFRTITSLIKAMAGTQAVPSGSLSDNLTEIVDNIKSGKIVDAFKMPFMTGIGMNGLKEALPNLDWPELDLTKAKDWVKRGVSGALPEDLAITQSNEVAISAKDEQIAISAGLAGEQLAIS